MAPRIVLVLVASSALVLSPTSPLWPEEPPPPQQNDTAAPTGIVTDRLSREQLRTWRSILAIIMAKDKKGRYLHPTLFGLYRQAATSGHVIRIELAEEESFCTAGRFSIEKLDPNGSKHIATIRLNLDTISRTHVSEKTRLANGLIPFAGLCAEERYAEALGHELAHAVEILRNTKYLELYQEWNKELSESFLHLKDQDRKPDDLDEHLNKIKLILDIFEQPAQAAELAIWRELRKIKKPRHPAPRQ